MGSTPFIEARGLTKTYRLGEEKVVGVVDASLTLEKDAFAVLAGPSGSGKTTLLNLLGLMDRPDSGERLLGGERVERLSEDARSRLRNERLGFVFQFDSLLPEFTIFENALLPARIARAHGVGFDIEHCRQ